MAKTRLVKHDRARGIPKSGEGQARNFTADEVNDNLSLRKEFDFCCPDCGPDTGFGHVKQSDPYRQGSKWVERVSHFALLAGHRHTEESCPNIRNNLQAAQNDGVPIVKVKDRYVVDTRDHSQAAPSGETLKPVRTSEPALKRGPDNTYRFRADTVAGLQAIIEDILPGGDIHSPAFQKFFINDGQGVRSVRDVWFDSVADLIARHGLTPKERISVPVYLHIAPTEDLRFMHGDYSGLMGESESVETSKGRKNIAPVIISNDPFVYEAMERASSRNMPLRVKGTFQGVNAANQVQLYVRGVSDVAFSNVKGGPRQGSGQLGLGL